jgi:hypothetical protein
VVIAAVIVALAVLCAAVAALALIARRLQAGFDAIERLASSAQQQGADLRRLGDVSAQSVRIASGAYVFELRDRFDEALGLVQIGVAETGWTAVHADGTETDEPLDIIVFEEGDLARARLRLVLSQAPVRRVARAGWTPDSLPAATRIARPIELHAASGVRTDDGFELPSDLSLFVDAWLDVDLHQIGVGPLDVIVRCQVRVTDVRPEGAVVIVPVRVRLRGAIVPDDGGLALDVATIEAETEQEMKEYFLVKDEAVPLDLPRVAASL